MIIDADTIVAIATPPGKGGVGIVRVSGSQAAEIANKILGKLPASRQACFSKFIHSDGCVIDEGIALYFKSPNSFTGEDVLELQGHGGPVVLDLIVKSILQHGPRIARPGEFSQRAFLNNKLDLAQAEAIADLIDAGSEHAAIAAQKSLQGVFSAQINELVEHLTELRIYVEAAIDFPDEEVDFLSDDKVTLSLAAINKKIKQIKKQAQQGCLMREGMTVVLAGQPNVGKSSLLNCLSGKDSAIVTAVPGTTRDVLINEINIDGLPVHIVDTAGLHESDDIVEQEGMRRAWEQIENADQILLVIDDVLGVRANDHALLSSFPKSIPVTIIHNKIDLSKKQEKLIERDDISAIYLSATQEIGIDKLRQHLKNIIGFKSDTESVFTARRRHLDALESASDYVESGSNQLQVYQAGELLAEDLRQAQRALSEITGEITADELLGKIFSSFCIGK